MAPKSAAPFLLTLAALVSAACGTHTEPIPEPADSYAAEYDPGVLIYATVNCDRLLTHALLAMNRLGDFDLSINIIDDCSRSGGGYGYGEVLILGTYTWADSTLQFTPATGGTGPFSGTFDSDSVRLTLPARTDSLAATPLQLHLPRVQ
jgi:hypothetical protein